MSVRGPSSSLTEYLLAVLARGSRLGLEALNPLGVWEWTSETIQQQVHIYMQRSLRPGQEAGRAIAEPQIAELLMHKLWVIPLEN